MSYKEVKDLPDNVKNVLPQQAQEIYKKAFNSAWDQYDSPEDRRAGADREEVSHRVAWSAVKQKYYKGSDEMWRRKDS